MKERSSWTKDDWTVHALNVHGTFFEHWCRSKTASISKMRLVQSNYPVAFVDGTGRSIESNLDIWAESFSGSTKFSFIIECKKNNPALTEWIFLKSKISTQASRLVLHGIKFQPNSLQRIESTLGITTLGDGLKIFEDARETKGDFRSDQKRDFTRTANSAIADACRQVVVAFKDLYAQHAHRYAASIESGVIPEFALNLFLPCIITTAKLYSGEFDPENVDPVTGEIALHEVKLECVPFALLEYPLPRFLQYIPTGFGKVGASKMEAGYVRLHILVLNSDGFEKWIGPDLMFLRNSEFGSI